MYMRISQDNFNHCQVWRSSADSEVRQGTAKWPAQAAALKHQSWVVLIDVKKVSKSQMFMPRQYEECFKFAGTKTNATSISPRLAQK